MRVSAPLRRAIGFVGIVVILGVSFRWYQRGDVRAAIIACDPTQEDSCPEGMGCLASNTCDVCGPGGSHADDLCDQNLAVGTGQCGWVQCCVAGSGEKGVSLIGCADEQVCLHPEGFPLPPAPDPTDAPWPDDALLNGKCFSYCGNGIIDAQSVGPLDEGGMPLYAGVTMVETCDLDAQGNGVNADGALVDCRDSCSYCGDGVVDVADGEECDVVDGSDSACTQECTCNTAAGSFFDPVLQSCVYESPPLDCADDAVFTVGDDCRACPSDVGESACQKACFESTAGDIEREACVLRCTCHCGDGEAEGADACYMECLSKSGAHDWCVTDDASSFCDEGGWADAVDPTSGEPFENLEECMEAYTDPDEAVCCRTQCASTLCAETVQEEKAASSAASDAPLLCGNGVVEEGEECDDGEENSDTNPNACRTNCKKAFCGDSVKDDGEACDAGRFCEQNIALSCLDDALCNLCYLVNDTDSYCGGVDGGTPCTAHTDCEETSFACVWSAETCTEECQDPGALAAQEDVSVCGNGVLEEGEECDSGSICMGDGSPCVIDDDCREEPSRCVYNSDADASCTDRCTLLTASDDASEASSQSSEDTARTCGDGTVDEDEECDDGNTVDDDGCSARCIVEYESSSSTALSLSVDEQSRDDIFIVDHCGNGVLDTNEQCDDGNTVDDDGCSSRCLLDAAPPPVCGNGVYEPPEECDDGNARNDDGCSSACLLEVGICGDGVVQSLLGEQCEPSFHDTSLPYGCKQCRFYSDSCGDGTVDQGEECDVGVRNSWSPNAPCRPDCSSPRCGDGILDREEQCDDGNLLSGDGCNRYCLDMTSVASNQQIFFPELPTFQPLPTQLPLTQLQPLIQTHGPVGDTGPAALGVIVAGAAAGISWVRRNRNKK